MAAFVYGKTEATTFHKGVKVHVHKDEAWSSTDPFVKARPDLFDGEPEKVKGTEPKKSTRTTRKS